MAPLSKENLLSGPLRKVPASLCYLYHHEMSSKLIWENLGDSVNKEGKLAPWNFMLLECSSSFLTPFVYL